jgi:hypothetical protein
VLLGASRNPITFIYFIIVLPVDVNVVHADNMTKSSSCFWKCDQNPRQIFCLVFSCNFDQIFVKFSLPIIGSWLNLCLLVSILAWLELAQEVAWNFSWSFLSNLIDIFTRMIFFTESAEGDNGHVPENDHLFDEGVLSAFCGSVNPFLQSQVVFLLQLWGGCKHLLSPFSRVNGSS